MQSAQKKKHHHRHRHHHQQQQQQQQQQGRFGAKECWRRLSDRLSPADAAMLDGEGDV